MDKIAMYKGEIEKRAQSKWRELIDTAKNHRELSNSFSEFNRNKKIFNRYTGRPGQDIGEMGSLLSEAKRDVKQNISKYNKEYQQLPFMRKRVSELTPDEISIRKNSVAEKSLLKKIKGSGQNPMDIHTGHDPEEYLDIIHGTNRSKAKAFLNGGNGASQTESLMNVGGKSPTDMGIMVHNKVKDRAEYYAKTQSGLRAGDPVTLEGRIKRKYLYPNPSRGSGLGDEYSIPSIYHNKIENARINSIEKKASRAWKRNFSEGIRDTLEGKGILNYKR